MEKISSEGLGFHLYKRRDHISKLREGIKEEPIRQTMKDVLCNVLIFDELSKIMTEKKV